MRVSRLQRDSLQQSEIQRKKLARNHLTRSSLRCLPSPPCNLLRKSVSVAVGHSRHHVRDLLDGERESQRDREGDEHENVATSEAFETSCTALTHPILLCRLVRILATCQYQ